MKTRNKIIFWLIGAILLLLLLKFPYQKLNRAWSEWGMPLAGKIIVIDPGHGGPDGGAVGSDDTQEKDIALDISKELKSYLEQGGAIVHLTRESDRDLASDETKGIAQRKSEDIRERLKFIEEKEADYFLSVHLNALGDGRWRGAQTFYYPSFEENELLAKSVQSEIVRNLENTNREALSLDGIYLMKYAKVPGALVEVGFLSNQEELQLLKSPNYQKQMASSIYYGVLNYEEARKKEAVNQDD